MGINFKIAIYAGFAGAIFFSVVPIIFKRKNFKEFIENFFMFLIGFTIVGFITTLIIDTQMSSPERLKRTEAEHNMDGHFIHLHNMIMPSNKKS